MSAKQFNLAVIVALAFCILACSSDTQPATQVPKLTIELVHSSELRPALSEIRDRFNAAGKKLNDGRQIQLELIPQAAFTAASGFASGEIKSTAWLAPGEAFVDYANAKTRNLGAKLVDCTTIFSTPVVYVTQKSSTISMPQEQKFQDIISLFPFAHGLPRDASSIFAVLQQIITTATKSFGKDPLEILRLREQNAYRYDSSESALLEDLISSQNKEQRVVVTTEQIVKSFIQGKDLPLEIIYPAQGSSLLEYKLCASSGDWVTAAHRAAIDEFRSFLQSADTQAPFSNLGFRTTVSSSQSTPKSDPQISASLPAMVPEVAIKILDDWREIRRPASIVFIVDTSGSTDSGLLEATRANLRLALAHSASRDLQGLITFGSDAKVQSKIESDAAKIMPLLDTLQSAGGAALYDAIKLAASEFEDVRTQGSRRAIFVITDSNDKNSSNTSEALRSLLLPLIENSGLKLVVLAVPSEGENVDQLAGFTKSISGTFKLASLSEFNSAFEELAASIQ